MIFWYLGRLLSRMLQYASLARIDGSQKRFQTLRDVYLFKSLSVHSVECPSFKTLLTCECNSNFMSRINPRSFHSLTPSTYLSLQGVLSLPCYWDDDVTFDVMILSLLSLCLDWKINLYLLIMAQLRFICLLYHSHTCIVLYFIVTINSGIVNIYTFTIMLHVLHVKNSSRNRTLWCNNVVSLLDN